jgi:hypothetical protein
MDRSQIIAAIEAMARAPHLGGAEQLQALFDLGFDEAEANRIVAFFPVALSRPIIEQLGVSQFSDRASVPLENGGWLDVSLMDQPEYAAALSAARDHVANGTLPHEAFKTVVLSSADVAAVSEALNKGQDIKGGCIATAFHDVSLAKYVIR